MYISLLLRSLFYSFISKLTELENELNRLAASEVSFKNKDKFKEAKLNIFLKDLSSKTKKVDDDSDRYDKDSPKEEEVVVIHQIERSIYSRFPTKK